MKKAVNNSEMLNEYDFSKGIRGKYAQRYASGSNAVLQTFPIKRTTAFQEKVVKADLVAKVAEVGITKKQATEVVDCVFASIKDALAKGDKVSLIGFGTFSVKKRAAREGRNPRSGKKIKIPAKKVPSFKPGKALKEAGYNSGRDFPRRG